MPLYSFKKTRNLMDLSIDQLLITNKNNTINNSEESGNSNFPMYDTPMYNIDKFLYRLDKLKNTSDKHKFIIKLLNHYQNIWFDTYDHIYRKHNLEMIRNESNKSNESNKELNKKNIKHCLMGIITIVSVSFVYYIRK